MPWPRASIVGRPRSWRLERKLVVAVLLLMVLPTVAGILLWLATAGLVPGTAAGRTAVALGLVGLALYLILIALALGRSLGRRLQTIQLGTELMTTANPHHRLAVRTGDELEALAEEINRMADRLLQARTGLEEQVARTTEALAVEREKLSAVIESLGEAVVVATPEGRVSLANTAARELLESGGASLLGRNLFELVDREKVEYFVERLRTAGRGAERFTLQPPSGGVLQAVMTPFFDGGRRMIGVILVLHDVTRAAQSDEERRRLFASTLLDLRGPLASIRSLSESLLAGAPGVGAASGDMKDRLLEAIHSEAVRLSGLVKDMAETDRFGLAQPLEHFETITVADLTAITLRRLTQLGTAVEGGTDIIAVDAGIALLPRIKAEASALSGAFAELLRDVVTRCRGERVWLRVSRRGAMLQFDAGGPGRAALADLEACLDLPIGAGGRSTIREIVRHHAAEVWGYVEGAHVGFRLILPIEKSWAPTRARNEPAPAHEFLGAGIHSGSAGGDRLSQIAREPKARPDFYDFSLFDEMRRSLAAADLERPLDEVTCVVFDTETTGLHVERGDQVLSVAAVRVRNGVVKHGETFDALVNPGRPIPAESVRFHGITDAMVAGAPPIDVVLPEFLRFAESSVLVGHQVWFDLAFLGGQARRLGLPGPTLGRAVLDTLVLSEIVHGPLKRHGLDTMAERFAITIGGRHSALGDALVTAEILVRLIGLLRKRGLRTLGEVLEVSRRTRDPSLR
jgi:DNA polymerase III subunit epsilon